ncbi:MAG: MFS transporter [Deltaproteobacteria bacterium]|nr:MFS transporter [Deltaproteobacteria bacterium]
MTPTHSTPAPAQKPFHEGLLFSNAGHFLNHVFMLLYPTVVLALGSEFGLSYGKLLSLSLPGFILYGAGALPAGWLADRWGIRGMMALFFFGTGTASILTGLAWGPVSLSVGLGLLGLFASIYHPVGVAWVVAVAKNRGRALGINSVAGNFGVAMAATVAAGLTAWQGWRTAFIVPGLVGLALGTLFLWRIKEAHGESKSDGSRSAVTMPRAMVIRLGIALAVGAIGVGLVFQATTVALPKLFTDRLGDWGTGLLGAGSLVTMVYLVSSTAQLTIGFMMERFNLRWFFMILALGQVPLLLLASNMEGLGLLVTIQALVFLSMGSVPLNDMLIAKYTPPTLRGRVYGIKFVLGLGVSSLGVPLVAMIRDLTGSFTLLLLFMAGCMALVGLCGLLLPDNKWVPAGMPAPGSTVSPSRSVASESR